MTDRIYTFMGLAQKAGKLFSGTDSSERAVKSGRAKLVIVAEDASRNTRKKFEDMCRYHGAAMRVFGMKELLGRYAGKDERSVIAIAEQGFAKRLIEMIDGTGA